MDCCFVLFPLSVKCFVNKIGKISLCNLLHPSFFFSSSYSVHQNCRVPPAPQSRTSDFPPGSLPFHGDRLEDGAFQEVSRAAGDAGLRAEEADKYSEPFSEYDSGSECRSRSPKSSDLSSNRSKQLQSRPSRSNHSSGRSSSSHTSSGSLGRLSDRSHANKVASEQAESANSRAGSGNEQMGSAFVSEGLDKLNIWSVSNLGGLSDN